MVITSNRSIGVMPNVVFRPEIYNPHSLCCLPLEPIFARHKRNASELLVSFVILPPIRWSPARSDVNDLVPIKEKIDCFATRRFVCKRFGQFRKFLKLLQAFGLCCFLSFSSSGVHSPRSLSCCSFLSTSSSAAIPISLETERRLISAICSRALEMAIATRPDTDLVGISFRGRPRPRFEDDGFATAKSIPTHRLSQSSISAECALKQYVKCDFGLFQIIC